MRVDFFTHPKHNKGGNMADTYDGELTDEGRTAVQAMAVTETVAELLKRVEARQIPLYCGIQNRHLQTRNALGLGHVTCKVIPECGNDVEMFKLTEQGDETIMHKLVVFLGDCKAQSREEIFIVTSRLFPLVMLYIFKGAAKRFGNLRNFGNAFDMVLKMQESKAKNPEFGETLESLFKANDKLFTDYAHYTACCDFLLAENGGALRMLGQATLTQWEY
jgi:hypothetical protein